MPAKLALPFWAVGALAAVLAVVLLALLAVILKRAWKTSRVTPEERERRRRAALEPGGKMGDATVLEIRGELVFYQYAVRGVEYTASQDISGLKAYLPADLYTLAGTASVKYDPRNPANSMVLSENWSGLRAGARVRS